MKRIYQAATSWWWLNDRVNVPTCTVIEREPVQQFSGLLDSAGNKLMVTLQQEPAGFVVFPERRQVPAPPEPTTIEKGGVPKFTSREVAGQ